MSFLDFLRNAVSDAPELDKSEVKDLDGAMDYLTAIQKLWLKDKDKYHDALIEAEDLVKSFGGVTIQICLAKLRARKNYDPAWRNVDMADYEVCKNE